MKTPDLTKQPPRSARVRLGGYALLPRMLDKGRAVLAGKNGEYKYACPLDQRFLEFVGVDAKALQKQLATGKATVTFLSGLTPTRNTNTLPRRLKRGLPGRNAALRTTRKGASTSTNSTNPWLPTVRTS